MPEIKTGPVAPKKSSGGATQALVMIIAWVGGAAAAAAVAFWILQYLRPPQDPEVADAKPTQRAVTQDVQERKERQRRVEPKPVRRESNPGSTLPEPEVPPRKKIDRQNFQRPDAPGLVYHYFESDSFAMPDFAKVPATRSSMVTTIADLPGAGKAKGLQLEGYWVTQSEQPCDFVLNSTNDARLWIDDQLVLDNTNQFEPGPVKATREILSGVHKVRAEFLLKTHGGSFQLDVAGEGDPNRINLDQLLMPFGADQPSSLEKLQYELASYPRPAVVAGASFGSGGAVAGASFFETESRASRETEVVKAVLPDEGRLLVGVAIVSSGDGKVVGVKPIYFGTAGLLPGETMGQEAGEWQLVMAKPGYAVSGVEFGQLDLANVQYEFMLIGDKLLFPEDAYTQTLAGVQVPVTVDVERQPIVELRGQLSGDSELLGVEVVRALGKKQRMLTVLAEGFSVPAGLKETPAPSVVKKQLKKLAKESAGKLTGKAGRDQLTELKALASSVELTAGDSGGDVEAEFVTLLEARRLYLLAGDFKSAFAITNRMMEEFDYDHWKDALALFADSSTRAGSSSALKKAVLVELGPAINRAEKQLEFEVAGRLAVGGIMISKSLKDQFKFQRYQQELERFEKLAGVTKQARVAAKKLLADPDDGKSNQSVGVFLLAVSENWGAAMSHFALSSNSDCQFIAEHDQGFTGADAKVAMKLADCWVAVGKKEDALTELASKRARAILEKAKGQADDKSLKDIEAELKNL